MPRTSKCDKDLNYPRGTIYYSFDKYLQQKKHTIKILFSFYHVKPQNLHIKAS
jgi:hypothetical protein